MKDRVPANPGRVLITPEDGSSPFYATMTRADNPTQEGDPLCKDTLLKDATAALLGGDETMVPDEALVILKTLVDSANELANSKEMAISGSYVGTGQHGASDPAYYNSLTFDFEPKLVLVFTSKMQWLLFARISDTRGEILKCVSDGAGNVGYGANCSFDGNTVRWASGSAAYDDSKNALHQMNTSGSTYRYYAFGS